MDPGVGTWVDPGAWAQSLPVHRMDLQSFVHFKFHFGQIQGRDYSRTVGGGPEDSVVRTPAEPGGGKNLVGTRNRGPKSPCTPHVQFLFCSIFILGGSRSEGSSVCRGRASNRSMGTGSSSSRDCPGLRRVNLHPPKVQRFKLKSSSIESGSLLNMCLIRSCDPGTVWKSKTTRDALENLS